MVQHDRQPAAPRETTPPGLPGRKALAAARDRYQGSLAQGFVTQLGALDFVDQIILFGAGLLVSLLPFLILLSAFASNRVDDDIALRLGLNRQAAGIMTHLLTSAPATLTAATATSLLFVAAGTLAVAGSLQQIYEKAFGQEHRGWRGVYRLLIWVVAFDCLIAGVVSPGMAIGEVKGSMRSPEPGLHAFPSNVSSTDMPRYWPRGSPELVV